MSKVKTKKQSTFIDMTAMSDVTVLLLTFFMLTATFLPKEPVQVNTPSSVVEIKIPESSLLTILVSPKGQVFLNFDRPQDKLAILEKVAQDFKFQFTDKQKKAFVDQPSIGVPFSALPKFLNLDLKEQDEVLKANGVPSDSTNNQLKEWIKYGVAVNENLKIAVKSDKSTPYPLIKSVFTTLQDIKQNRFNLITTLKGMPAV
ncbi:MAG: biopolymer transporter ExbD [Dysgonamonadaceae bacterium]